MQSFANFLVPCSALLLFAMVGCGSDYLKGDSDVGPDQMPDDDPEDASETSGDMSTDPIIDVDNDFSGDPVEEECMIPDRDQCKTSEDCGGRSCVRFPDEPGGMRYCELEAAIEASGPAGRCDECTSSDDCTGLNAVCFTTSWSGCYDDCGGPPWEYNICVQDECASDEDCPNMCIPANLSKWKRAQCVGGSCRVDSDCSAEPCGYCARLSDPCCGFADIQGYFCVYPGSCGSHSDCEGGMSCIGDRTTGGTYCDYLPCPT